MPDTGYTPAINEVPTATTLQAGLHAYLDSMGHTIDAGTLKNVRSKISRFLAWCASPESPATVTCWRDVVPLVLDGYALHRLRTPSKRGGLPKPDTVARDLMAVRDWLRFQEERELTGPIRSAHALRPLPTVERDEVHVLTPEIERQLLERARWIQEGYAGLRFPNIVKGRQVMTRARQTGWKPGGFHLYVLLMLRCGLRPAEALKLRWDELHLDSDPPLIRMRRRYDDQGRTVRGLKTSKSQDAITLARRVPRDRQDEWSGPAEDFDLVDELRNYREQTGGGEWVFGWYPSPGAAPQFPDDAFIWRALKHETGDPKLRAYSCRHTVGTRLAARGFSSEQIARCLRNTARVCERHYIAGTRDMDVFDVTTGRRLQVRAVSA